MEEGARAKTTTKKLKQPTKTNQNQLKKKTTSAGFSSAVDVSVINVALDTHGSAVMSGVLGQYWPNSVANYDDYFAVPVEFNGAVYFAADDGDLGYQLWKTDMTTGQTTRVTSQINTNYNGIQPWDLTIYNGSLYFQGCDDTNYCTLWTSDGTDIGTNIAYNFGGPANDPQPDYLTVVNGFLYFTAFDSSGYHGLWKSDGTYQNTFEINPNGIQLDNVWNLVVLGKRLYFTANDAAGNLGNELWITDGTEQGTRIVRDIFPGPSGSNPNFLTNVNGILYFSADDGIHGTELWVSLDGTPEKTFMVMDIYPGSVGSSPAYLTALNNAVIFSAYTLQYGVELWRSDATSTFMLKDIYPGSSSSDPSQLSLGKGIIFFVASTALQGAELWATDGTPAGTRLVSDIHPGTASSNIQWISNPDSKGTVYFSADDGSHGQELWKSNGSPSGTMLVSDLDPAVSAAEFSFVEYGAGSGKGSGICIGKICKCPIGGCAPSSVFQYNYGSTPLVPIVTSMDTVYFLANGTHFPQVDPYGLRVSTGYELYMSNGTSQGTMLVYDVNQYSQGSFEDYYVNNINYGYNYFFVPNFYEFNGIVYFSAYTKETGQELWKTDGTPRGTMMIKDITGDADDSFPDEFTGYNGLVYFSAWDNVHGRELWVTDGTEAGTHLVIDLYTGDNGVNQNVPGDLGKANSADPYGFTVFNGLLYFFARESSNPKPNLYQTNGFSSGTSIVSAASSYYGYSMIVYNNNLNNLYFSCYDSSSYYLCQYDGVSTLKTYQYTAGTKFEPSNYAVIYNTLYMSDGYSNSLFAFDDGTNTLSQIGNGYSFYYYDEIIGYNNKIYFTSNADYLYSWDPANPGNAPVTIGQTSTGSSQIYPYSMALFNNMLYFIAQTGNNGYQLWQYDGTNALSISNFNTIYNSGYYYNYLDITGLYVSNNYLYFGASTNALGAYTLFYLDVNGNSNNAMDP